MKVVFLYTELAKYTIACLKELSKSGVEILVFRYPINKEAPFVFEKDEKIIFHDRFKFTPEQIKEEIEKFSPDLVFCSGWIDKTYLKICGHLRKKKLTTVLCLDNQWKFSPKQLLATMAAPFFIKPRFSLAWVPGKKQVDFVRKLGFSKNKIYDGFYCADTSFFSEVFTKFREKKKEAMPKRFVYIGRYHAFKGLSDVWEAFSIFHSERPDWELWCIGTGDLEPVSHPAIKHLGFIQPESLSNILSDCGVFILPSRFEPWGVVVHEMASAGFPLLLSTEVGASETFLKNGENGFLFNAGNIQQCYEAMKKVATLSNEELNQMSERSVNLAAGITTATWVSQIMKMYSQVKTI